MRYRLRTLMILLAVGPPMLAGVWLAYDRWQNRGAEIKCHFGEGIDFSSVEITAVGGCAAVFALWLLATVALTPRMD